MNTNEPKPDPLEHRLSRQPLRELPAAWREEILAAAEAALPQRSAVRERHAPAWWRAVLWPNPVAWASVAAVWVAILGLNHAGRWEPVSAMAVTRDTSPGLALALIERRRQLNEMLEVPAAEPAPAPPSERPAPRGALTRTNHLA